jgi:hypothetical protein
MCAAAQVRQLHSVAGCARSQICGHSAGELPAVQQQLRLLLHGLVAFLRQFPDPAASVLLTSYQELESAHASPMVTMAFHCADGFDTYRATQDDDAIGHDEAG